MNQTQIELHVPDFNLAEAFYSKYGFELVWKKAPEESKGYMVMSLEDNLLRFWGGNDCIERHSYFKDFPSDCPRGKGVELVVQVKDIQALWDKMKNEEEIISPLAKQPWGLQDFRVKDPFGFYLRFTSKHDVRKVGRVLSP